MAFNLGARMTSRSHRKTRPEPACRDDTGLHLVPPGLGLVMLEARAPWEAMALAAVSPWLSRMPSGDGLRVDHGLGDTAAVSPHYDSMIAKVIAYGADREQARGRLQRA